MIFPGRRSRRSLAVQVLMLDAVEATTSEIMWLTMFHALLAPS
jgi:hypothetical protein